MLIRVKTDATVDTRTLLAVSMALAGACLGQVVRQPISVRGRSAPRFDRA